MTRTGPEMPLARSFVEMDGREATSGRILIGARGSREKAEHFTRLCKWSRGHAR